MTGRPRRDAEALALRHCPPSLAAAPYAQAARVLREGPAPLLAVPPGAAERTPLHIAVVLPSLPVGSGGHGTVLQAVLGLERLGHTCSLWVLDDPRAARLEWPATLRRKVVDHYAAVQAPVLRGFESWYGADVAMATSWETAYAVAALPGCRARAYMLNDHEVDFHPASVERVLAEGTYALGLHALASSRWLQEIYEGHGGTATPFELGLDHDVYRPMEVARRRDTVVFYGRQSTPRRAVPLGVQALAILHVRRPQTRIVVFGDRTPLDAPFPYEHAGVATPAQLARLFSEGTAGLCLSLTNYSLVAHQMLACGMPCVELDGAGTRPELGEGAVELAPFDPEAVAAALAWLLDDEDERARRARDGLAVASGRTWERTAAQVEAALREALRAREPTGA